DAAGRVRLRIEEDLGVPDTLAGRPLEVRPREIVEVALVEQHAARRVVHVEERLKILDLVRAPERLLVLVGQLDVVAPRHREREVRFERPLDVKVELGFGEIDEQLPHRGGEAGQVPPPSALAAPPLALSPGGAASPWGMRPPPGPPPPSHRPQRAPSDRVSPPPRPLPPPPLP